MDKNLAYLLQSIITTYVIFLKIKHRITQIEYYTKSSGSWSHGVLTNFCQAADVDYVRIIISNWLLNIIRLRE